MEFSPLPVNRFHSIEKNIFFTTASCFLGKNVYTYIHIH